MKYISEVPKGFSMTSNTKKRSTHKREQVAPEVKPCLICGEPGCEGQCWDEPQTPAEPVQIVTTLDRLVSEVSPILSGDQVDALVELLERDWGFQS
jgi:hypothetical protein